MWPPAGGVLAEGQTGFPGIVCLTGTGLGGAEVPREPNL